MAKHILQTPLSAVEDDARKLCGRALANAECVWQKALQNSPNSAWTASIGSVIETTRTRILRTFYDMLSAVQ